MKHTFSMLTISGLMALGMAVWAPPSQASAIAGSGVAKTLETVATSDASKVERVNHRRRHWHRRHFHPHHRHHLRPRTGFYFEFGTGRPPVIVHPPYYAPPRVHVRPRYAGPLPVAHVRWCYSRYRSYRDWDNTFQPYNGPRKQCRSPYWG
jgi:BA14K-like protein.